MRTKLAAVIIGLLTSLTIALFAIIYGQILLAGLADLLSSKSTQSRFRGWDRYNITSDFFSIFILGLTIALGLMVAFIMLDFKDKFRRRLFIYIPFFIVILGCSSYNYFHFDYIIRPDIQAIFNLVIIFFGLICNIKIWNLKVQSTDGIILKYLILFILIFCSVLIPCYFSISWLLHRLGIPEINLNFNMPIITTLAGLITTTITVLKFLDDKRKSKSNKSIIDS